MFKRLTNATYFLARQALQLRKERMYSQLCVKTSKQNNKHWKTFEETSREIMVVRQKIVFGGDCRKRPTVQMSFRSQNSTVYLVSEHLAY